MNISKALNPIVGLTGLLALALSAGIALAEVKEKMKIKVVTGDGISETVTIEDLAVGDSEVFITESGKEVYITREEEALSLEVDGRVIDVQLPKVHSVHDMGAAHKRVMFISDEGDIHEVDGENVWVGDDKTIRLDVDVDAHHDVMVHGDGEEQIIIRKQILSDGEIIEEEVQALLESIDVNVEGGDGEQEIIIIKKHVELHEDSDHDQ
ncbi:MAG: hypothetical protein QNJ40_17555 [Xanthomonadales bacterium]|nr:hypothetical protein [Xanthomonadales bacterium]